MAPNVRSSKIVILIITLLAIVGCTTQPAPTATPALSATTAASAAKNIVVADISDSPAKTIAAFQPLADYLGANLKQFEIGGGEVKVAKSLDEMIAWMKAGEVDIYFDSPFPAMMLTDQAGAQAILRRWKGGVAEYHSVLFARKDSGIKTVEDLKGKMFAFDEPYSTSGYILPKAYLIQAGLNPVEKSAADAAVGKDEIGYVFSQDDENIAQWVISGKVAAGSVDSIVFSEIPEENRAGLIVLAETKNVPRHLVIVRSGMSPEMIEAIKKLLLDIDKTPEGKDILTKFQKTTKFDDAPGGIEAGITQIRDLYKLTTQKR